MAAKKKKQPVQQSWSFPFFGAGEASYFEWAEVHVLFTREPSEDEKQAIERNVPLALRDSFDWEGPALMVASDQFAHVAIAEQFAEDDDEDDDDEDDDDEYGEGGWFFASSAAVSRFNAATEAWLHEAHGICPILLAFRGEDGESGGTELSAWHEWSVRQIAEVLANELVVEILASGRDDHRAHLLVGVIEMADEAEQKLPPAALDWAMPERTLERGLTAGDEAQLRAALGRGARVWAALEDLIDLDEPGHVLALLGVADLCIARDECGELDDDLARELVLAAVQAPEHPNTSRVLGWARERLDLDASWADSLAYAGFAAIQAKQWPVAIAIFELVIEQPELELSGFCNGLYAIMNDNNGLPIDADRHRRFIARALPHAEKNPAIFFNVAALSMELGEHERVFESIELAIRHGYEDVDKMRDEPLFAPLRDDPRFAAAFAGAPAKKKAAKKKAAKKKSAKKKAAKKKT